MPILDLMTKYYKKFLEENITIEESLKLFSHIVKDRLFSNVTKDTKNMIKAYFQLGLIDENGRILVTVEEAEKMFQEADDEQDKDDIIKFFKR